MASIVIEISGINYTEDVVSYLERKKLRIVHNYKSDIPQDKLIVKCALKHESGVTARIMAADRCKEDRSYLYTISNNNLSREQMYNLFWKV
jgi:hypothetical protein